MTDAALIDDMSRPFPEAAIGTRWEYVADTVMGGVSAGGIDRQTVAGRAANRLTGRVSLDNDGGFIQMALNLRPGGGPVNARGWSGITLDVIGNGARYNLHLRTADVTRPWQSYRATFTAPPEWTTLTLPFAELTPHRVDAPFDAATLRRLGLVAIGREFAVDLAGARIGFAA